MKVGVIGVGNMGKHHVRAYRELGLEMVGVADIDSSRAKNIAYQQGTTAFSDYRKLLDQKPDAVSIAIPTNQHREIALEVISRNINLLVEKPIANSLSDAIEIVSAAEKKHVVLMIGYIERYNPIVQKIKHIMASNMLGRLVMLSTRRIGPLISSMDNIGVINEVATHDIDIIRYLTGLECESIYARSIKLKNCKGDSAIILLTFKGINAFIEVNWYTPYKLRTLAITGSEGAILADYQKQEIKLDNYEGSTIYKLNYREPLKIELKHFVNCIDSNKQPMTNGKEAIAVLDIALKAGNH